MLDFQNISICRKGEKVLDHFNLKAPDGVILALLGEDKEAKSMLLKTASGGEKPEEGQIYMDGISIYEEYGFYNLLKVEEYYELFLSLYKVGGRYRSRRIEEVLEMLEMTQYKQTFIGELPIDTFPFLYLGKAILQEPEWLLMDDPFDNMSVTARKKMIGILLSLHEKGTSMIINTSMYPEMMGFITDVVVIEEGKNLTFGPVEEVYAEALCKSPVRMHILAQMEKALEVLKENHLVDRVTVDGDDVIFRFNGGEKEEAELLTDLVASGALIHNYMRDLANIEEIFRR